MKPEGLKLYENLKSFIRKHHEDAGYLEVKSPSIVVPSLFEQSGHMDKYKDNMFFLNASEASNYALRPMSCPNHILIYQSEKRSYRELPLLFLNLEKSFAMKRRVLCKSCLDKDNFAKMTAMCL